MYGLSLNIIGFNFFKLQTGVSVGIFQRGPRGHRQLRLEVPGHQSLLSMWAHPEDYQGLTPENY